jgi:hypothetical protein
MAMTIALSHQTEALVRERVAVVHGQMDLTRIAIP